ncbi:MAG: general stress protein CsbD [Bacteroidota bacterium]|nr:general stress protein CsbD [Bacteroidota bacterium]
MKSYTELKGDWITTKGKLKQKFGMLPYNDLIFIEGKQDEMLGRLEAKLGKTKQELLQIISDL